MRKSLYLLLVAVAVACGVWLYGRGPGNESRPSSEAEATMPRTPPPRLAKETVSLGQPPDRDAGMAPLPREDDEAALMQELRVALTTNPPRAEALAHDGRARFPNSPASDERDMLLVIAVFNQGDLVRARVEASRYVTRHPGGRYTKDLVKMTGISPPEEEHNDNSR
jgi:hypothetical protein